MNKAENKINQPQDFRKSILISVEKFLESVNLQDLADKGIIETVLDESGIESLVDELTPVLEKALPLTSLYDINNRDDLDKAVSLIMSIGFIVSTNISDNL